MIKISVVSKALLAAALLLAAASAGADSKTEGLEQKLGITRIKKGDSLKILLTPQARCFFGDLDIIYRDSLRLPEGGKILVTLESLAGGKNSKAEAVHDLYNDQGVSGEVEMKLPKNLPAGGYGIFICSDLSGKRKNCAQVPARSFAELLAPYEVGVSDDGSRAFSTGDDSGTIPEDHLYFFRPLVITKDAVFYTAKPGQGKLDGEFAEYIKSKSAPNAVPSDRALAKMNYIDAAISSIPFTGSDKVLKAILPYYSPFKCGTVPK